jgi:monoamine oxidase
MGAIDALGVGANGKLHLQIADRFWTRPGTWGNGTGESYADTGYQEAWAARGLPGTTGLLVDYLGGTAARRLAPPVPFLDSRDPDAARRAVVTGAATDVLRQIEPVFPGMTARATGLAQLAVWHANPLTRGAYSYYTPGYCERFCTIEGVPARPFHFAGEHCSQEFQGFMEGAVREGQRAAQEIVADYR